MIPAATYNLVLGYVCKAPAIGVGKSVTQQIQAVLYEVS